MEKLLFTTEEVAELCSLGRTTVYAAIKSGRLASLKVGTARRVTREAVEDFIESLRLESGTRA